MKKEILSITKDIVQQKCPLEFEIFVAISDSLYDKITSTKDESKLTNSSFSEGAEVLSTIIMIIITTAAIEISKEGVKFSKYTLKKWINKKINNSKKDDNLYEKVLNLINDYLNDE